MDMRNFPWSELGTDISGSKSVNDMLKQAGLDWKVNVEPMQLKRNGKPVGQFNCLVKSNDGYQLDVVGKAYVPTQNHEAFELFNEYVTSGEADLTTIGSLQNGRIVWGLAKMGDKFDLGGDDVVEAYMLLVCPHVQGKALVGALTPIRFQCANTIRLALRKAIGRFRMVHRQEFNKAMQEKARKELGLARDEFKAFETSARRLKKKRMNNDDARKAFDVLTGNDEGEESRVVNAILDAFHNAPGADPKTAWGAFNAVTYYADHVASRTPDKRLSNAWFGKTSVMKKRALDLLLT